MSTTSDPAAWAALAKDLAALRRDCEDDLKRARLLAEQGELKKARSLRASAGYDLSHCRKWEGKIRAALGAEPVGVVSAAEREQPSSVVTETVEDLKRFRRRLLRALRQTEADLRLLGVDVGAPS